MSTGSLIAERFMRYVKIDTQSDPDSTTYPSTEKQKDLSRLLVDELKEMGWTDVELDEWGYVIATIPSNSTKKVPVICFCSHVDTAPDCSGKDVQPILHLGYNGTDIVLPDDPLQIISTNEHPYLKQKIGDDIITASGKTLLGADDKAGVAIIMQLASFLKQHPEIIHGEIKILFTPDEEVGRGVEHLDLKKLGADLAYTLDGGELGSLESETFSADGLELTIYGVIAHPGYAKGKLVNAIKLASEVLELLPKQMLSPEVTEGREGFMHPTDIRGTAEQASIKFILRDFEASKLDIYAQMIENAAKDVLAAYPSASYSVKQSEQYRNMKEVLAHHPEIVNYAEQAMIDLGIRPIQLPVRGGTDGSRLSFMGLPCPNIFTGEMALHSKHEFVSVQDMEKSMQVLVRLLQIWEAASK
ncbi:MAG: peptidase T [Chitinophagia bacterium]|nr:peptidase T [Chitinophagia bacterium]